MPEREPRALRESRECYRLLFERATDGIWLADQQGRFVDVNPAACRILGYSRAEHLRLTVDDVVRPGEKNPRLRDLMRELGYGHQVTDIWEIRRADASYVPLELSHAFTPDGRWQAIGRDITERRRIEAERERQLRREHEIVEVLQRSLLPGLPHLDQLGLAVRYQPAISTLEVGGDWYDVLVLDGQRIAVAVGDVVGKGTAAAAVMGQLSSAARALLLEGHGPAHALTALDTFSEHISGAYCSTVFCAVINPVRGTMCYSSAGHPPAILDCGAEGYRLLEDAQAFPLAVRNGKRRPQAETVLPHGATLLLYTDGLVERRGQSIDVGITNAAKAVEGARHLQPAELADLLAAQLVDPGHNDDDVAFLLYRQP